MKFWGKYGEKIIDIINFLIPYNLGFAKMPNDLNPNIACSLLHDEGFVTKNYIEEFSGSSNYFCASPYKVYDSNNIAFYASGSMNTIFKIELGLNVNNLLNEKRELKTFQNYCSILFKKILKNKFPVDIAKSIMLSKPIKVKVDNFEIELEKEIFPSKKGYRLNFKIK